MQTDAFYEQLGNRIQSEREKQHMSREKLAEKADVSAKFLYEIETGRKGFSCRTLYKLCDALHVSTDYILSGEGDASDASRVETMLRDYSVDDFSHLIKIMEILDYYRKR